MGNCIKDVAKSVTCALENSTFVGTQNGVGEDVACSGAGTPLESNLLAVATAETLAKGKNRADIEEICKFLQLLQAALKAYM